jgi:hypothetical protein
MRLASQDCQRLRVAGADFVAANAEPFGGLAFVEAIAVDSGEHGEKFNGHFCSSGVTVSEQLHLSCRRSRFYGWRFSPPLTTDKRLSQCAVFVMT